MFIVILPGCYNEKLKDNDDDINIEKNEYERSKADDNEVVANNENLKENEQNNVDDNDIVASDENVTMNVSDYIGEWYLNEIEIDNINWDKNVNLKKYDFIQQNDNGSISIPVSYLTDEWRTVRVYLGDDNFASYNNGNCTYGGNYSVNGRTLVIFIENDPMSLEMYDDRLIYSDQEFNLIFRKNMQQTHDDNVGILPNYVYIESANVLYGKWKVSKYCASSSGNQQIWVYNDDDSYCVFGIREGVELPIPDERNGYEFVIDESQLHEVGYSNSYFIEDGILKVGEQNCYLCNDGTLCIVDEQYGYYYFTKYE